jgi:hypothetical protein
MRPQWGQSGQFAALKGGPLKGGRHLFMALIIEVHFIVIIAAVHFAQTGTFKYFETCVHYELKLVVSCGLDYHLTIVEQCGFLALNIDLSHQSSALWTTMPYISERRSKHDGARLGVGVNSLSFPRTELVREKPSLQSLIAWELMFLPYCCIGHTSLRSSYDRVVP